MSDENSPFTREQIFAELQNLREDVKRLEGVITQGGNKKPSPSAHLKVFFSTTDSERKPYLLKMDGALSTTLKLSSVRAAIMLVLILDLQDRLENGRGVVDLHESIARAFQLLEGNQANEDEQLPNNIRVALYRFGIFCESNNNFAGPVFRLDVNPTDNRISIVRNDEAPIADGMQVEVTTNDAAIAAVLDQTLATSPLARVRKRKALFVPGGPEGYDRLLLELYDHSYPVTVTTTYFRPAIQSYPTSLLQQIGMSEKNIHRKKLVFEGYKSKRCRFIEILNFETIWDMIRKDRDGAFKIYPANITQENVVEHLDHLIFKIDNFETYELILTNALFPFYLGTFDIQSGVVPEYFTVFFRRYEIAFVHDVSCFIVHDSMVNQGISDNILQSVLAHSSTIRERSKVREFVCKVRDHLSNEGPIIE